MPESGTTMGEEEPGLKASAVIVAAGRGRRMSPDQDKLFLEVEGLPLVAHTWKRFDRIAAFQEIVLVVQEAKRDDFNALAKRLSLTKPFRLVAGGAERQDSVWNGLEGLASTSRVVAIQDGARPCTDVGIVEKTVQEAWETGAAVAAVPVSDTIKESWDGEVISRHLDRATLWAMQTPQAFRTEIIRRALAAARETNVHVTDDTAACELIGQPVRLVSNPHPNPKLTRSEDLPFIELLLRR